MTTARTSAAPSKNRIRVRAIETRRRLESAITDFAPFAISLITFSEVSVT